MVHNDNNMYENEHWRPVPGHPNYQVSDMGRVRSVDHWQRVRGDGRAFRRGKVLKPGVGSKGHLQVQLDGGKWRRVHTLVLEAFVGPRPGGKLGLHRDGQAANNRVENLYWGTHSDNAKDAVRHGTHHQASKTECKYGHPLDGVRRNADGSVRQRYCKTCFRKQVTEWKQRHRKPRPPLLTSDQVAAIKADTRALRVIGAEYGVSHTTVRKVQHGLYG